MINEEKRAYSEVTGFDEIQQILLKNERFSKDSTIRDLYNIVYEASSENKQWLRQISKFINTLQNTTMLVDDEVELMNITLNDLSEIIYNHSDGTIAAFFREKTDHPNILVNTLVKIFDAAGIDNYYAYCPDFQKEAPPEGFKLSEKTHINTVLHLATYWGDGNLTRALNTLLRENISIINNNKTVKRIRKLQDLHEFIPIYAKYTKIRGFDKGCKETIDKLFEEASMKKVFASES